MITDPIEKIIDSALAQAGIRRSESPSRLDFYLPDYDVHIECKQFHTSRISEQTSRVENVIVIQGIKAAETFARFLSHNLKSYGGTHITDDGKHWNYPRSESPK